MSVSETTERVADEAVTPSPPAAPGPSIAEPGPLGLAAFATTTFLLSLFNAHLVSADLEPAVLPIALFYGGIAQFAAGMWEFRKGNTFGAVAFSSYGAFWLSFAAFVEFVAPGIPESSAGTATGLFLLVWTVFTGYMTVAALRVTPAIAAVFVLLFLTFLALTIGELAGITAVGVVGGVLGLLTAIAAWYASFAGVLAATWGRTVLPGGAR